MMGGGRSPPPITQVLPIVGSAYKPGSVDDSRHRTIISLGVRSPGRSSGQPAAS